MVDHNLIKRSAALQPRRSLVTAIRIAGLPAKHAEMAWAALLVALLAVALAMLGACWRALQQLPKPERVSAGPPGRGLVLTCSSSQQQPSASAPLSSSWLLRLPAGHCWLLPSIRGRRRRRRARAVVRRQASQHALYRMARCAWQQAQCRHAAMCQCAAARWLKRPLAPAASCHTGSACARCR